MKPAKLTFYGDRCVWCGACEDKCPQHGIRIKGLARPKKCAQSECGIEEAPCRIVCPKGAIIPKEREGVTVLVVDRRKCDGCGLCAQYCPLDAITIRDKKAYKCDLCIDLDFDAVCENVCREKALEVDVSSLEEDVAELKKRIGWDYVHLPEESIKQTLLDNGERKIVLLKNGEIFYCYYKFPDLGRTELEFMQELISRYRTGTEADIAELGRKKSFFELVDSQMLGVKKQYFDVLEHMGKELEGAIAAGIQKEKLKRIKSFPKEIRDSIAEIVLWNSLGYGPFFMTQDPLIEEITVNGPETPIEVYLRRQRVKIGGKTGYIEGWISTNFMFTANTKDFQTKFINKLTFWEKIPKKLVAKKKLVDFSLPDGSRLNATIPPLSPNGYTTTIRVFRKRPISPLELIEYNTISSSGLSLLSLLLWYGYPTRNIVVIGPTSSGKTSTVNALCSFIPSNSRIIVPEETMELNLPHPPKKIVRHIATEDTPLSSIIINTLRERPDRIVIGEVRKPDEIKALFECFSTSPGMQTLSTSHGKNPRAVFKKFMQVGGVAPINLADTDLIIWQNIFQRGLMRLRRIAEVVEVTGELDKDGLPELRVLYKYSPAKDRGTFAEGAFNKSALLKAVAEENLKTNIAGLKSRVRKGELFFNKLRKEERTTLRDCFERFNSFMLS